uniref:Uncharacterized protein n=1 Tax=Panagrolaimus sp. ES5 TaxID=591445 RepID=A0AC34GUX0_9BILA
MNSANSYKSKLRAFSQQPSSSDEKKHSEKVKSTMKFEKMANLKTPFPKKSHSKMSKSNRLSPPPAPRANRSILEVVEKESGSFQNNNDNNMNFDATPKRRSQKRTRLSEATTAAAPLPSPPKKRAARFSRTKSTQTASESERLTNLAAENFALSVTVDERNEEIRKIKRNTQTLLDNIRTLTENFSFNAK